MFLAFAEPAVVENLTIIDVTISSVSLNWTKPIGNSASYTVQWTGGGINSSKMTNETSSVIYDLIPGTKYNITVVAVAANSSKEGDRSLITTFTSRSTLTFIFESNLQYKCCLNPSFNLLDRNFTLIVPFQNLNPVKP